MKPSEALALHRSAIRQVVASHRACNARVFGSVLKGQDTSDSDLDLLVDPTPQTTLMDVAAIQWELQRLLGVTVDVLTPKALPDAFRQQVLDEAVPVIVWNTLPTQSDIYSCVPSKLSLKWARI